jgi:hypothetical protein
MNIAGDLIALEEQFWKGDADFYRQRLTAEALMVFPDPVGVLGQEETVASISQAPRWRDVEATWHSRMGTLSVGGPSAAFGPVDATSAANTD